MSSSDKNDKAYGSFRKFKVVLMGDQSVGKSCILGRFVSDSFEENTNSTIGVDFVVKTILNENINYKFHFWDTAGQERFHSLIPSYVKNCQVVILVYDVTNLKSFENLKKWHKMVLEEKEDDIIN